MEVYGVTHFDDLQNLFAEVICSQASRNWGRQFQKLGWMERLHHIECGGGGCSMPSTEVSKLPLRGRCRLDSCRSRWTSLLGFRPSPEGLHGLEKA